MMINGWIMSGDTAVASFYGRIVTPILPERCPLCFQRVETSKCGWNQEPLTDTAQTAEY